MNPDSSVRSDEPPVVVTRVLPNVPHPTREQQGRPAGPEGRELRRVTALPARREPSRLTVDVGVLFEPEVARAVGRGALVWLLAVVLCSTAVVYLLGPYLALREQASLTRTLRADVAQAVGATQNSFGGPAEVAVAPAVGAPVAVLAVPRLRLEETVVEGADPAQLRSGPGHVPGTAGLGQPGNAVVVARRHAFGGPFGDLRIMKVGDPVVVTTVQGQSVYEVTSVERETVSGATYGPSREDRLTLVTSDSWLPWNADDAVVVTAKLRGQAFVPTPPNGRSATGDGTGGDGSAWPLLVLELLGLLVALVAATVMYRRWSRPATYLLTTPALVALLVFTCLTGSRLLPAWF